MSTIHPLICNEYLLLFIYLKVEANAINRVFAISSVDNNIIYHVSNSKPAAGGRHKVQSVTGLDGRKNIQMNDNTDIYQG